MSELTQDQLKLLVNDKEASTALRISTRKLFDLRRKGVIRSIKIGARVLYSVEELRAFVERQMAGAK